jgi:predicted hydrocarbon binding protein
MKFFQKIITSKIVEEAVANATASIVDEIGKEIAKAIINYQNKENRNVQLHSKSLPYQEPTKQTPRLRIVDCG